MNKPIFKNKEKALEEKKCFDCGKEIKIEEGRLEDGSLLLYEDENKEELFVLKCDQCYSKESSLSEYKECEVYSRIVGYLRPLQNWHDGKKQEFKERATFIL